MKSQEEAGGEEEGEQGHILFSLIWLTSLFGTNPSKCPHDLNIFFQWKWNRIITVLFLNHIVQLDSKRWVQSWRINSASAQFITVLQLKSNTIQKGEASWWDRVNSIGTTAPTADSCDFVLYYLFIDMFSYNSRCFDVVLYFLIFCVWVLISSLFSYVCFCVIGFF